MPVRCSDLVPFGVEVVGIDLSRTIEADDATALRNAFAERHLLVFRGHDDLTPSDQQRVVGLFGPLLDETRDGSGFTFVSNTMFHDPDAIVFHSDLVHKPTPLTGLSLYAVEIDGPAPPTRFVDTARALERVPGPLRSRVEGMQGLNVLPKTLEGTFPLDRRLSPAELAPDAERSLHPVVMAHPETGTRLLFVNEMQTQAIADLSEDEGAAVIAELLAILYDVADVLEHDWRVGDLVVWDNLAVQHSRAAIPPDARRTLRRVPLGIPTGAMPGQPAPAAPLPA
jgi:taurine dioxygenase